MRFAIIGVGGAGGYFGARLAEAGHDVAFIARGDHLAAIRKDGLRVESIAGDVVVTNIRATDDPSTLEPADVVIIATKSWQVPEAARAIVPLVGPDTVVVPMQNGVEAIDQIAAVVGRAHTLGGVARIVSFRAGPGHIRHTGVDPSFEIGALDDHLASRVTRIRDAFASAKAAALVVSADIRVSIWKKLLFLAPWAGVGAVTRATLGALRTAPGTRRILEAAVVEIDAVARANGVALPSTAIADAMSYLDALPHHGTTSMQRDIVAGVPSELDSLCGAVVRIGARASVPTPTHRFLFDVLSLQEQIARDSVSRV